MNCINLKDFDINKNIIIKSMIKVMIFIFQFFENLFSYFSLFNKV